MIIGILKEDTKVLLPNKEHRNFTETDIVLPAGRILKGNFRLISGLRRGEPFTYKLFITNEGTIIYQNKINPMATEVKMGADSSTTATNINLLPAEKSHAHKYYAVVIGAVAGFAYAKYKKHDMKKAAMWIGVGAVAGYLGACLWDTGKKAAIITPSK